ncbi:hypothetical protein KI387_011827, partial [Taxus chinensis]
YLRLPHPSVPLVPVLLGTKTSDSPDPAGSRTSVPTVPDCLGQILPVCPIHPVRIPTARMSQTVLLSSYSIFFFFGQTSFPRPVRLDGPDVPCALQTA